MSFSNPLWNDMIIRQLLDIDQKLSNINTRLDYITNRLDNIERNIYNNMIEEKPNIPITSSDKKDHIYNEIVNDDDDGDGEWMKVNRRYNKRRF
jgi:hypothetical protein